MFTKGDRINDRYEIIKLIGEGGMANVYLAYDTILERDVAVKVLRGDLADDEKFVRRFQREALSASSLNHPNIVEMYDVGEDNGNFYIVMEYIKGKTLKQLIKKRGHLTLSEAIDIMMQLTSGLSQAHDSYIIHRDIKPQNIMILEDGLVKITDFGIAMAINAADLTQTNSVMGSVHYLPPEQAAGKGSTIKSDIYSLGILFYEMLSGTMPFRGETAVEIALKHIKEEMPSIRKVNSKVPQSVENIIFKYPEDDLDETKVIDNLQDEVNEKMNEEEEINVKEVPEDEFDKKNNKLTKWLIIICSSIIGIILLVLIFTTIFKTPEVRVPDVSNLTTAEATKILEKKGLIVSSNVKEDYTDEVKKGKVSKTKPKANEVVKKGATITLYKSLGSEKIKIKDYTNQDYNKVQAELEVKGLQVSIDYKVVDDKAKYKGKEDLIIGQSVEKGTNLVKGDPIILYLPKILKEYPDFVKEKYTLDEVKKFCQEYGITLKTEEKEDDSVSPGTIIAQSSAPGSEIADRATLTITLAKKSQAKEDEDMVPYQNDTNTNEENN